MEYTTVNLAFKNVKMRKFLLSSIISLCILQNLNAQKSISQAIQDTVLGWTKVYHFKGYKEGRRMDDLFFSPTQLSFMDSLANWMQVSYIPKAGIGNITKTIGPKIGRYNADEIALPQLYGTTAWTWNVSSNNGKLEKIAETQTAWSITANLVPATSWAIPFLCSANEYYFTLPLADPVQLYGSQPAELIDFSKVNSIRSYPFFWIKRVSDAGASPCVILCKNNKLPFIKLSKGEFLKLLEKSIPRVYEEEKKKIVEKAQGNQRDIDYFLKYEGEKLDRRLKGIARLTEKYRDRLGEFAKTSYQPTLYDIESNDGDPFFSGDINNPEINKAQVYQLDPDAKELCKKDKPQWITISWIASFTDPNIYYRHEAIINNFNFDYVYNFFFDPDKVKNLPYRPLHTPSDGKNQSVLQPTDNFKGNGAMSDFWFFDDFSANGNNEKPAGWNAPLGNGNFATVKTVDGENGKWVQLKGNFISAGKLRKPLPDDFTLTFDLIVPKGFTWGGKAIEMMLANEKSELVYQNSITLRVRPGFNGSDGKSTLNISSPSGIVYGKEAQVPGFSNDKNNKCIKIALKRNQELLEVYTDNKQIINIGKAIPADLKFNFLSFSHISSDNETEKYYISNVKITKD